MKTINLKQTKMKTINQIMNLRLLALLFAAIAITSCSDDDDSAPAEEEDLEVITNVNLIFTSSEGDIVMASAVDPDGEGILELQILDPINLNADTEYVLTYEILNALDPTDPEDIAEEISEEDNEHQLFYGFTNDVFATPTGDGNIDNASDLVLYNDQDENGYNVGLSTTWRTSVTPSMGGEFTTRLQHQPDLKSGTTGSSDGDTDFDLTFVLNIQ